MKTIIISIIGLSLASCVTTTTTSPDGSVTVVRGVDPAAVETITAGVIAVGATIDQSSK